MISKNILSENLGINKNFILVEQNTTKTLKSIYINEKVRNFKKEIISLTKFHYSRLQKDYGFFI